MTATTTNTLILTGGLTIASWAVIALGISRMDIFGSTAAGAFASFMFAWLVMISAMMLPGVIPTALRFAQSNIRLFAVGKFLGSYLTVWMLVGLGLYMFRFTATFSVTGPIIVAAGIYELLPLKRIFRKACCRNLRSGFQYGLACVGSCAGLMMMQVAVGMTMEAMLLVSVLCLIQKLVPDQTYLDVPIALTLVAIGLVFTCSTFAHHPAFQKQHIIDCLPN